MEHPGNTEVNPLRGKEKVPSILFMLHAFMYKDGAPTGGMADNIYPCLTEW